MRTDMHKVICEEPRHGGGPEKYSRRANLPHELLVKFEGIRRSHKDRKRFGEHLGPLRRWLRSQLGRRWDDVYSEACAVIKPDSVVRNHIKFHLLQFVQRNTFMRDGAVWCFSGFWGRREIPVEEIAGRWSPFYVHPQTGLLCEIQARANRKWRDKAAERRASIQRWISDEIVLHQIKGIWFECAMTGFPERFARGENPLQFDLTERCLISPSRAREIYGREVRCVAKRQLSRQELRKLGLANRAHEISTRAQSSACVLSRMLTPALGSIAGRRTWVISVNEPHVHQLVRS